MERIQVKICCGTACYVLGASKLLNLENEMPADWKDKIDIRALPCLNLCESENLGGAPYVKIDDDIVAQATVEKVLAAIRKKLLVRE